MNLSSFLKQYRRNNCLSQGDIARITGLDRTTISKIESGERRKPTIDTLEKLGNGLDFFIGDLMEMCGYTSDEIDIYYDEQEPNAECIFKYKISFTGVGFMIGDSIEDLKENIKNKLTEHSIQLHEKAQENKILKTDDEVLFEFNIVSGDYHDE